MRQILDEMATWLPAPTEDDLKAAEAELRARDGQTLNGHDPRTGKASNIRISCAKDPDVFKLQVRAWALGYVARRELLSKQGNHQALADDYERRATLAAIQHDHEVCAAMMGASSIFAKVSLSDTNNLPTAVLKFLTEEFPYQNKKNCLLLGSTGSGKTFGAIGYIAQRAAVFNGEGGKWVNAVFLTAYKLSEMVHFKQRQELARLETVPFLIIDDLGTEPAGYKGADFTAHFENLFTTRHQHGRSTFMTSNGTKDTIRAAYGDRFVSRFRETGVIFTTDDADLRDRGE